MESVENKVKRKIQGHKRGKIFFPNQFNTIGSPDAVRQALKRLEDKEYIIRLAHGIYLFPKKHKTLGVLHPTTDEIANAIAKRDKARLIPTGAQALNKLGISTQVPMNFVYLTDGSPRTITIGNRKIKFKKASPKLLSTQSDNNILIIQALRELGNENITNSIIGIVHKTLHHSQIDEIKHDMKLAPTWIAQIMQNYLREYRNE